MLERVCNHVHNYFIRSAYPGEYEITGGSLPLGEILKEGQRFQLIGSDLNDGVYTWHADGIKDDDDKEAAALADEAFAGTILAMAPPKEFLAIVGEIADWVDAYGAGADSPYQSENVIGVYSYTKASGAAADGSGGSGWESAFASRLNPYRTPGRLL